MKKVVRKDCKFFVVNIINNEQIDKKINKDLRIFISYKTWLMYSQKKFQDYLLNEIWTLQSNWYPEQYLIQKLPID